MSGAPPFWREVAERIRPKWKADQGRTQAPTAAATMVPTKSGVSMQTAPKGRSGRGPDNDGGRPPRSFNRSVAAGQIFATTRPPTRRAGRLPESPCRFNAH